MTTQSLPLEGGAGERKWRLQDGIAECKRELHMRERVYPNLIGRGQLTEADANKHNKDLQGTLRFLEFCLKNEVRLRQAMTEG